MQRAVHRQIAPKEQEAAQAIQTRLTRWPDLNKFVMPLKVAQSTDDRISGDW